MTINCRTDFDLATIGIPTQAANSKIYFNYTDPIRSCVRIALAQAETNGVYRSRMRNKDHLNCPNPTCIGMGALMADGELDATIRIPVLAQDYALGGVFTYNLHIEPAQTTDTVVTVTNRVGNPTDIATNADVYTKEVTVKAGETDVMVAVALSDVPTAMDGTGWIKNGASVLQVTATAPNAAIGVGIGNVQVFDGIDEFAKNNTGWISCLTSFEFSPTIDATDPDCLRVALDPTSADTEVTITAKRWSPNLLDASPLLEKTDDETHAVVRNLRTTVPDDARVTLTNFSEVECGFVAVQGEGCSAADGRMSYMALPDVETVPEDYFQIIREEDNGVVTYYAKFNPDLVGSEVTIVYPETVDASVYKINISGARRRDVRIEVPYEIEGGDDYRLVLYGFFNNIPLGLSTTENQEAEFTFTPTPVDGYIGEIVEVHG